MTDIILHPGVTRDAVLGRIQGFISALSIDKAWHICVKEWKGTRSQNQNRYLWGVCYETIIREGGEAMQGWTKDDLHEFFLIEHFGHEVRELFGRKRMTPLNRSSKLSKSEFSDFVATIQRFMAERGVYIPEAGEVHVSME